MEFMELVRRIDKQVEIIQRAYAEIDNLGQRMESTLTDYSDAELQEISRLIEVAGKREWSAKGHFSTILYNREKEREAQGIVVE